MNYLIVFLTTIAMDYAWTKYITEAAAKHPMPAALWSGAIVLCSAVNVVHYAGDPRTIVASVLGAVIGTWIAVKRAK